MRLVLDTAVMVAALRSNRGASNQLLAAGLQRRYALLTSVPIMLEYEAVLTRSEHLDAAGLTREDVCVLLDTVAAVSEPIVLHFLWRPQVADPDDDMVLETAANGRADGIATFNLRDLAGPARRFSLVAERPGVLLRRLQS